MRCSTFNCRSGQECRSWSCSGIAESRTWVCAAAPGHDGPQPGTLLSMVSKLQTNFVCLFRHRHMKLNLFELFVFHKKLRPKGCELALASARNKVSSLTLRPLLENGRLQYEDAPLVRAAKHGRVCVAWQDSWGWKVKGWFQGDEDAGHSTLRYWTKRTKHPLKWWWFWRHWWRQHQPCTMFLCLPCVCSPFHSILCLLFDWISHGQDGELLLGDGRRLCRSSLPSSGAKAVSEHKNHLRATESLLKDAELCIRGRIFYLLTFCLKLLRFWRCKLWEWHPNPSRLSTLGSLLSRLFSRDANWKRTCAERWTSTIAAIMTVSNIIALHLKDYRLSTNQTWWIKILWSHVQLLKTSFPCCIS